MKSCPCGHAKPLSLCCGPFLDGTAQPDTAEQLMRSRYVAYALRRVDYLLATHAPKTRPRRADIAQWAAETTFTGLQILGAEAGGPADQRGTVTFVAQYRNGGQAAAMMEHSRFERVGGAWLYVDGDHTA